METPLKIYTDGGCSGNPGPGGWAYVMVQDSVQGDKILAERWGAEENTTNNRMELTAVIESLWAFKTMNSTPQNAPRLTIYTDSQYVQKGITDWIHKWKQNSWRTSDKKPVKNQDLWMALDSLAGEFSLNWVWVQGHAGIEYNEYCDRMTQQAIASINR
ncbi:MAG: ribonuclease HI [Treponema sp.]|jgi:ribonuclease HI|nr:ribonuclease HI [Treponema sp.]